MLTSQVTTLEIGAAIPLYVLVDAQSSIPVWRRVGTILRTATRLAVAVDHGAEPILAVWEECARATPSARAPLATAKFGVPHGRLGIAVVAEGHVTRDTVEAARSIARRLGRDTRPPRRPRREPGLGPRPLRAFWPESRWAMPRG